MHIEDSLYFKLLLEMSDLLILLCSNISKNNIFEDFKKLNIFNVIIETFLYDQDDINFYN